jgi:hypothetical protein
VKKKLNDPQDQTPITEKGPSASEGLRAEVVKHAKEVEDTVAAAEQEDVINENHRIELMKERDLAQQKLAECRKALEYVVNEHKAYREPAGHWIYGHPSPLHVAERALSSLPYSDWIRKTEVERIMDAARELLDHSRALVRNKNSTYEHHWHNVANAGNRLDAALQAQTLPPKSP